MCGDILLPSLPNLPSNNLHGVAAPSKQMTTSHHFNFKKMGKECTHATECISFFTGIVDVNYSLPTFYCLILKILGKISHISKIYLKTKE
jgi:hypothetical protein